MEFSREQEEEIRRSNSGKQLACTYLPNGYHVTTCYRDSGLPIHDRWFYETFVWYQAPSTRGRKLVHQSEYGHSDVCERIIQEGAFWEKQESDDE